MLRKISNRTFDLTGMPRPTVHTYCTFCTYILYIPYIHTVRTYCILEE